MIPIDSDGSIGAKHILLTRAMSMRLYDRAFRSVLSRPAEGK
jgi:hypothetical protein